MEEETPKYQIYLSTSPDVQRSSQAILTEGADGKFICNYMGEGSMADAWFMPAVAQQQVLKGNVYVLTHPDDYEGGMYEHFKPREEPQ